MDKGGGLWAVGSKSGGSDGLIRNSGAVTPGIGEDASGQSQDSQ